MSKFKVGDKVRCLDATDYDHLKVGEVYTVISATNSNVKTHDCHGGTLPRRWELVVSESPAITAARKKLADLQAIELAKQQKRRERKAKNELAKLMRGLSPGGRRIAECLRLKPDAFGCQREMAIALAAAITGDDADKIRKALG